MCGHLERQAADLEATAHPALDALTRASPPIARWRARMLLAKSTVATIFG